MKIRKTNWAYLREVAKLYPTSQAITIFVKARLALDTITKFIRSKRTKLTDDVTNNALSRKISGYCDYSDVDSTLLFCGRMCVWRRAWRPGYGAPIICINISIGGYCYRELPILIPFDMLINTAVKVSQKELQKAKSFLQGYVEWTYKPWWGLGCDKDSEPVNLNYDAWAKAYIPITNRFVKDRPYDGKLYETCNKREVKHVDGYANSRIWTLVCDSNGNDVIIPGKHLVNRIGYFITKYPWHNKFIQVSSNENTRSL